jgi:4-hydroxybenzoate polyprenyltransferase
VSPYRTNAREERARMLRRLGRFEQCVAAVGVWCVLAMGLGYAADHFNVGQYMLVSIFMVGLVTFVATLATVFAIVVRDRE